MDVKAILKNAQTRADETLASAAEEAQISAMYDEIAALINEDPSLTVGQVVGTLRRQSRVFRKFFDERNMSDFCRQILSRLSVKAPLITSSASSAGGDIQRALVEVLRTHGTSATAPEVAKMVSKNPKFKGIADEATILRLLDRAAENHLIGKTGTSTRPFFYTIKGRK